MDFAGAIKAGFQNYAQFRGRATRPEYWWWTLFSFLVAVVASTIDFAIGGQSNNGVIGGIVGVALFLPSLAVLVRRFRDAGFSALWLLTWLVPFVAFVIWLINSIPTFLLLVQMGATSQMTPEQAAALFDQNPQLAAMIMQLLVVIGLFVLWSIFELVVTLLPSKKPAVKPAVATTDY